MKTLHCEQSLFSLKTVGESAKQVSLLAFFPTIFKKKRDCSQSKKT